MFLVGMNYRLRNPRSLEEVVETTIEFLNATVRPVLVGGPKLRVAKVKDAFTELTNALGYVVATMPSAKGQGSETLPHFIGTYQGAISTAFCAEIVESVDAYLFARPIFNDYSSVGYSLLLKKQKSIIVQPNSVTITNGPTFGCILMKDFFTKKLKCNTTTFESYQHIFVPHGVPLKGAPNEALKSQCVIHMHSTKIIENHYIS